MSAGLDSMSGALFPPASWTCSGQLEEVYSSTSYTSDSGYGISATTLSSTSGAEADTVSTPWRATCTARGAAVIAILQASSARAADACNREPAPAPPTRRNREPVPGKITWRGEQVALADFIDVRMPPPPCDIHKYTRRLE